VAAWAHIAPSDAAKTETITIRRISLQRNAGFRSLPNDLPVRSSKRILAHAIRISFSSTAGRARFDSLRRRFFRNGEAIKPEIVFNLQNTKKVGAVNDDENYQMSAYRVNNIIYM
ncbi:MAG: hypothetical protein ACRD19_16670, partial [Terriglobia bacterium]